MWLMDISQHGRVSDRAQSLIHKDLQQGRVVGSPHTSDGVPALRCGETIRVATGVATLGHIKKGLRVGVQHRVDKADSRPAGSQTLLVDASQHASKYGGGGGGSAYGGGRTLVENDDLVADGGHIWISTANAVVNTTILAEAVVVDALVIWVARVGLGEVVGHGLGLPCWSLVDVAETATRGEARHGHFLVAAGSSPQRKDGRSHGGHVRAGGREHGGKDIALLAKAVAGSRVSAAAFNTGVTRGDHDRHTLHAKLHDFIALATLVGDGQIGLGPAVGDGDHVGRFVHSALQLSLIAARRRVWVMGVERRNVVAVRTVDRIQEVVQEAVEGVVALVDHVVCLEQNRVLRPNDRIGDLEVQIRLGPCFVHGIWCLRPINGLEDRVCAGGNRPGRLIST